MTCYLAKLLKQAQAADDAVERELDKEKRRPKPPVSASQPTNNNK